MAKYQIMYWKEIPAQVKAFDEKGEFSFPLPARFQEVIDEVAMRQGDLDTDAYLNGWRWGEMQELSGSAEDVAKQIAQQLDAKYPQHTDDFLEQILQSLKSKSKE